MTIRVKSVNIFGTVMILALIFTGIVLDVNPLFTISLIVNILLLLYAYDKIENRSLLFAFGIAYFIFLLGREFLELYFNYKVEQYSVEVNNHTYICLILATLGIWGAYSLCERKLYSVQRNWEEIRLDEGFEVIVRAVSKWLFFMSMPFALITRIILARFVGVGNYAEYYTDFINTLYGGNTLLYIVSRLENIMPVALGIFFSTLPSKKEAKTVMLIYLLYCIISLGAGNRGTFVLGILFLFVFIVYMQGRRPEERWFEKKKMIYAVILVPVIAIAGSIYNVIRSGGTFTGISMLDAFLSFFYDQGVTITVIKHAYELEESIPKQGPYLLEFLHSGIPARLLGITVYHGNTVEHALHGGSFTHALAYTVMKNSYLAGRGTGTSYIAELYYDLKYIGVLGGSVLYGWLFSKMQNNSTNKLLVRSIIFILVTQFLWAPRGSYTAFLSLLFAPTTVVSYIAVWGFAKIISSRTSSLSTYKNTGNV